MNKYIITISDSDIISIDDNTGDVKLDKTFIPVNVEVGDCIEIHYTEDEPNIRHKYTVAALEDIVTLNWVQQLEEQFLVEKSIDKTISKAIKKGIKAEQQLLKKSLKLIERDLKEGQHWNFYLQKPDGTYEDAKNLSEIRDFYKQNMSPMSPAIANAIVTTADGYLVRRGLEDMHQRGVLYDKNNEKIRQGYSIQWDKSETRSDEESSVDNNTNETNTDKNTETEDNKEQQPELTPVEQRVITQKLLDKFTKLAILTELQVWDPNNKVVNFKKEKITPDTVSDYKIRIDNNLYKLKNWLIRAIKDKVLSEDCNIRQTAKTLLESPLVTFSKDDLMDPSSISLKGLSQQAIDKENQRQAEINLQRERAQLKNKYSNVEQLLNMLSVTKYDADLIDQLFEELVPSQGPAETVAGEYIRAIMRILYRYYNDGDLFFIGYGIETCGSSVTYLRDKGFEIEINEILDNVEYYANNEDKYTAKVEQLAVEVIKKIKEDPDLLYTRNTEDSRNYGDTEWLEEAQPKYDLYIEPSYEVDTLIDENIISYNDVYDYVYNVVEYEPVLKGCDVTRDYGATMVVTDLTKEGFEYLEELISRGNFWDDLINEYADELDDEEYDDYSEEE